MTVNNSSVSVLMQQGVGNSDGLGDESSTVTLETLAEIAGDDKIVTPEKLLSWAGFGGRDDISDEERERFAKQFAPVIEWNVNDLLVKSAAYSFLVLELEAYSERFGVPMQVSLAATTQAEQIRHALRDFAAQSA